MRSILLKLIIAQMALQGMGEDTIRFFERAYTSLKSEVGATSTEMGRAAFMCRQNASKHIKRLAAFGYVERINRYHWRVKDKLLTDGDLIFLESVARLSFPAAKAV